MSRRATDETGGAASSRTSTRALVLVGAAVCLVVAGVVSYFASSHPDGLEFVSSSLGFHTSERASATADSPLAGYGVEGVSNGFLSGGLAGVLGVLATAAVMGGLVALLVKVGRRRR